jgi:hypothetical protein
MDVPTIAATLAAWCATSIVFGILMGTLIKGEHDVDEQSTQDERTFSSAA